MIEQPPVPKEFFDRIWKMKVYYLRAKFCKWKDQRVYFVAGEDTFPWKVLESELKDPKHLPRNSIIVNAIYTGEMWRNPGTYGRERATIMGFRDVLFEWVDREGNDCRMTPFNDDRKRNKNRHWVFKIEEVLSGGLTLKRIRAGLIDSGRTLAEGSLQKKEPSAPRSAFVLELEKWEKETNR